MCLAVAIVIALLISCFWGACGVYRRRQLVASRSGRFPGEPRCSLAPLPPRAAHLFPQR